MRIPLLVGALLALASLIGCAERPAHLAVEDDLAGLGTPLVDRDSAAFVFPADVAGRPAYVTAVYTHCPDVCLTTMAQTQRIRAALGADTARVRFLTVTFDPVRDTPAVLQRYAEVWRVGGDWRLATGDSAEVARLMTRLGIRVAPGARDTLADGRVTALLDHSDKSFLLDAQGRVVETYGGSAAPPEMVAQDLRDLL